jgi:HAD superfamily hydrolase (TIGR01509 family)
MIRLKILYKNNLLFISKFPKIFMSNLQSKNTIKTKDMNSMEILENSTKENFNLTNYVAKNAYIQNTVHTIPSAGEKIKWEEKFKECKYYHYTLKTTDSIKTPGYQTFIFDIHNVLVNLNREAIKNYERDLYKISQSKAWKEYFRGSITMNEAYNQMSNEFNYSVEYIKSIRNLAAKNLIPVEESVQLLRDLKRKGKRLICLTNFPKDRMIELRRMCEFFNEFDVILSSGDIKETKPSSKVYEFVLNYCNLIPEETVFIDDKLENIESCQKLKVKTVLFKDKSSLKEIENLSNVEEIINYNEDNYKNSISPYSKNLISAYNYITKLADIDEFGCYISVLGLGKKMNNQTKGPSEIFVSPLMLLTSKQLSLSKRGNNLITLLTKIHHNWQFNFFNNLKVIPNDVDTTSVSMSVLSEYNLVDEKIAHSVIDNILSNHNEENIILTYFSKSRIRICPIVCAHALYLIHLHGRENHIVAETTKKYLLNYLTSRDYINGGKFYPKIDFNLFTIAKLVNRFPNNFSEFKPYLQSAVKSRIGLNSDDLSGIACRLISCHLLDIPNDKDFSKLIVMQLEDGSFPENILGSNGNSGHAYCSRGFSTMIGMKAIELQIFGKKQFL